MSRRRPSLMRPTPDLLAIEPLTFARVAPIRYTPERVLRLHRHHKGDVPGVEPRHIDLARILDRAIRSEQLLDRPRKLDTPPSDG